MNRKACVIVFVDDEYLTNLSIQLNSIQPSRKLYLIINITHRGIISRDQMWENPIRPKRHSSLNPYGSCPLSRNIRETLLSLSNVSESRVSPICLPPSIVSSSSSAIPTDPFHFRRYRNGFMDNESAGYWNMLLCAFLLLFFGTLRRWLVSEAA